MSAAFSRCSRAQRRRDALRVLLRPQPPHRLLQLLRASGAPAPPSECLLTARRHVEGADGAVEGSMGWGYGSMRRWVAGEWHLTVKAVEVVNRTERNGVHNAGWDGL